MSMGITHMIQILQAFQHGQSIEISHNTGVQPIEWQPMKSYQGFNFVSCNYRIAKPVPKKVKYYGWIDGAGYSRLWLNSKSVHPSWTRAPWLDGEVEE